MFARSVQIISRLDSQSKFQMFTLLSGRHVGVPPRYTNMHGGSIVGSVNLWRIFRRIFEVFGKRTDSLLYLSPITSQNWPNYSDISFLVQSALLGWLWGLPAAKELRRYGAMALWHYGPMALRCKL